MRAALSSLPDIVLETLEIYRDLIDDALPGRLVGLNLVGSIALDDFQPGRSDIDFVAVLDTPSDDDTLDALECIHDEVDARTDIARLDGFYVTADAFAREPERANPCPFHVNGRFERSGTCFDLNPVTWATLSRRGICVRGAPSGDLGITVPRPRLAQWCVENLRTYWRRYANDARELLAALDPTDDIPADLLAWAVTGPPRLHFTIETGEVTSKTGATRWAADRYDERWRRLLDTALSARRGEITTATAAEAVRVPDFIDMVVKVTADPAWPA